MPNTVPMPRDGNNNAFPLTPARIALARTLDTSISSSTEITLNAATTMLRCYATTQDVYFKWGTDNVTSSNFDEILPAGQIVDLVVPVDETTSASSKVRTLYTAVNLLERAASAAIIVIEK